MQQQQFMQMNQMMGGHFQNQFMTGQPMGGGYNMMGGQQNMMGGQQYQQQPQNNFGMPDASIFATSMAAGPGPQYGPGQGWGNNGPNPPGPPRKEKKEKKEDLEFGGLFDIGKTNLKDRQEHAPPAVDSYLNQYKDRHSGPTQNTVAPAQGANPFDDAPAPSQGNNPFDDTPAAQDPLAFAAPEAAQPTGAMPAFDNQPQQQDVFGGMDDMFGGGAPAQTSAPVNPGPSATTGDDELADLFS